MPAAAEADGVRAAGAGFLQLTEEHARSLISSQPIAQLYDVEEEPFARGKYAAVRRCRSAGAGASAPWRYAAKYLRKWRRATDLRPEILHEVAILHACRRSARVVKLFGVFESDQEMVLLLELAEGGELQTLLDRDIVPDEAQVRHLMRQILLGLRDLHHLNVAHLDIKPQNLVLTGEFPNGDVKLCDLGISRYVGEGADVRDMLGTPDYVAPEVLNYEPISLATDMWSVGVLVYVLLTGCSPFGGDTKQETFCNISQCNLDFPEDLFEDVSEEAKDLMRKLMVKEPSKRLTVEQSLRHSWFSVTQVPTPIGVVRETGTELSSKNSFRETERMSPVVAVKLEKSSPALSKKMDRPSPTMMRKPGKELPEPIKNNDGPPSLPKRTVPVTREVTSLSETSTEVSKPPVTTMSVNTSEVNASKEPHEDDEGNMQERSNGGMRSFRKNTFKRNMGSILERVTSCEDFENNNGFNLTSGTNNKNKSNNNSSTVTTNTNSSESNSHINSKSIVTSSINTNSSNTNGTSTSKSTNSNNTNNNTITSSHNSNTGNSISNSKNNSSHEKITHVSSISFTTSSSISSNSNSINTNNSSSHNNSNSSSSSTVNNTTNISSIYSCNISASVSQPKNNTVSVNRTLFETNKLSVRFSSSSKKIPAPETPAANSNASIASLTMPRPNRATAMQTMPLGGVREFRLKFELPTSSTTSTTTTTKAVPTLTTVSHSSTSTVSRTATTTTLTTTTSTSSSPPVAPLSAPVVMTSTTHTSSYNGGTQKNEEKDCVYTFRKCFIVDDGETENGNSLVSDGTNESETSSGYYDNSSCCSSSDSVSDVSETSTDSAGDRLSTASMDSLDSCYGKDKRHYSSTLAAFSVKNNYNKRVNSLKTESVSKSHQSPAFHLAVSTFSHQISENTSKGPSQVEEVEQEKIFAAARRQAAKASHTTVINKVARASFVPATQASPAVRKECALNITRERNGNEVVLQEVKAGKCSRFSEVKIESVQSRIKKFQS